MTGGAGQRGRGPGLRTAAGAPRGRALPALTRQVPAVSLGTSRGAASGPAACSVLSLGVTTCSVLSLGVKVPRPVTGSQGGWPDNCPPGGVLGLPRGLDVASAPRGPRWPPATYPADRPEPGLCPRGAWRRVPAFPASLTGRACGGESEDGDRTSSREASDAARFRWTGTSFRESGALNTRVVRTRACAGPWPPATPRPKCTHETSAALAFDCLQGLFKHNFDYT